MKYCKLTDICDFQGGSQPPKSDWILEHKDGYIRMLQIRDFTQNYDKPEYVKITNSIKTCKSDDILIARYGASVGKILTGLDGAYNVAIMKTIPNEEILLKKYLYYFLKSNLFQSYILNVGSRAAQAGFNKEDLNGINIQIHSIEEQEKIVYQLECLDNLLDIRKKEIEKCNNLIKSQFVEMLYLNPSANKLGEFISRYKAERANDIDYPVLSITKEFGIVLQSEKFKKRIASDDTSSYKVVPYGKLVQGIHIDERNFAIQNKVDNGIVSPAYKIWNVDETKCNSEVLAYALRSDYVMNYIRSKFTGSIKRRENINYEDFLATPINLPKLEIQNEFYKKKKLIDKQKFEFENSLKKLEELQASLMQECFG